MQNDNNNSKAIFSLALGLSSPWYLETVKLVEVAGNPVKELHIYINFHRGSTFHRLWRIFDYWLEIAKSKDDFKNVQITSDKFHIIQHLNNAMDTVRKEERKGNDLLKGHKYTFLKARC